MLQELIIKNLAIIDNLSISFKKGLIVLTGETGAGKSIIVDALGLALGERASSEILKYGAPEGSVQALFEIENIAIPEEVPVQENSLILRRHITSQGKNRAYVNDTLVNLSTLQRIGMLLVDVHSQHEHQSILNRDTQLLLLDAFGGLESLRERYKKEFEETTALRDEIKNLQESLRFKEQRIDLLRYQINEILQARLRPDEEEHLRQEFSILKNASRLSEAVSSAYEDIYGAENSCLVRISKTLQRLRDLLSIDPQISEVVELLGEAKPLLEEASKALGRLREKYNVDPERLDLVNERLDLIERLKKKYGNTIEDILSHLKAAQEELNTLELSDEKISELQKRLAEKESNLLRLAEELSEKRKVSAQLIEKAMSRELKEVGLEKAIFKINIKRHEELRQNGIDDIEFEFSANPGEPPKSLARVTSGGELSRLMLCIKVILAEVDRIPVLIFDEIDAGIGGATAEKIAQRLKKLSAHRQVLCITHLAQIASAADHHIKIEKIQKKDSVSVKVKLLSMEERYEEIARMLSGKVTDASLRHARELLKAYNN